MIDSTFQIRHRPVLIHAGLVALPGDLRIVSGSVGLVVFAHGSGSSRFSTRNLSVADVLHKHSISTLLIDLLTAEEAAVDEQTCALRFDIPLLAQRLAQIGEWAVAEPLLRDMKIGYFGSSTGGAAALIAAAEQPELIAAVVSRGGRVDLAEEILSQVKAPVLLIVGALDTQVLTWNEEALTLLNKESRLEIIPNATHLFEEGGALQQVAQQAALWFAGHFQKRI